MGSEDNFIFKLPLVYKDFSIEDADKNVVFPCNIYKSDTYHVKRQEKYGNDVVGIVNNKFGYFLVDGKWVKQQDSKVEVQENGSSVRNPWGRAGKPK